MRSALALSVTLFVCGCVTVAYDDLNLTPSPYTAVVRIDISTDQPAAGLRIVPLIMVRNSDAQVLIRDKVTNDTYIAPVRSNTIRARLGLGTYQVMGLESSKATRGEGSGLISLVVGRRNEKESVESRIEFSVLPSDLGQEVTLGSYNPAAQSISGDRLALGN